MATKKKTRSGGKDKLGPKVDKAIKSMQSDGDKIRRELTRLLKVFDECDKQVQTLPGAPSIDVETKKLERMVQKRANAFKMLSDIMQKYDQTAKNVIQSIGR